MRDFDSNSSADTSGANDSCAEWQPLLTLRAAGGELEPAEQERLSTHLAQCAVCSQSLERERELLALLANNRGEPDAALLGSCRANLADALDREEEGGWLRRTFGVLLPANWLAPRPAWSAAVLLIIGFSVGILAPRFLRHQATSAPPQTPGSEVTTTAGTNSGASGPETGALANFAPSPLDLRTADVAGINVLSSGGGEPPRVELQLRSQQPVTLRGTVDDGDVKSVLLGVLGSGERFCPDVRLDAVDLLRACNSDPDVRAALCHTVHTDRNAAVRMKALEALDGAGSQDLVRQTLLDALVDDDNPGVRVEAVNELREMAAKGRGASDDRMRAVLRERMEKDPNAYIRLQSAAAIRDLGPRAKF
ncbi:MAG: HEAT repeat domain-containing protein [Candidatus Acidiferrales bacterium]|jgi:hypothetical protein